MNYGKDKTLLARFKTEGWMDVVLYTIKRVHYRNNRNYNCKQKLWLIEVLYAFKRDALLFIESFESCM